VARDHSPSLSTVIKSPTENDTVSEGNVCLLCGSSIPSRLVRFDLGVSLSTAKFFVDPVEGLTKHLAGNQQIVTPECARIFPCPS
jgi:hypothetical protein